MSVTTGMRVIAVVCLFVLNVSAHPLHPDDDAGAPLVRRTRSRDINDNVLSFLMKFGYLPQSDLETGNLRTEDQVRDAIKTMQVFAHIPVTGVVDDQTRELMKKPRCGLPDIISDSYRPRRDVSTTDDGDGDGGVAHRRRHSSHASAASWALGRRNKRYTVQGQRWHYHNLTWSLRKGTRDVDDGHIRHQIRRALKLWESASRLTFTEINSEDADIRVSFHTGYHNDGFPFDGKGTLLAHAFFPGSGIGGDAHFDDDEEWVSDNPKPGKELSFYAVAAHEFGHSLGLSHSSVEGAIMYPYYQSIAGDYSLSSDDVTGIQAIYGMKHEGRVTNPAMRPTTSSPVRPVTPKKADVPTKAPTKKPIHPTKAAGTRKPNTCDTSYDAISILRGELFIFRGKYFWRIGSKGLEASYPAEIDRFWNGLPSNLTHIDAIYEKPSRMREMIIFIGKQYWIYPNNGQGLGPYPLTKLGLPADLEKIDGALVWGHNGKTYFFSGTMYWRYDEEANSVELDYPRDMSMWKGVPYNIDSVFQHSNGKTYFFKGKVYWEFNDRRMRVVSPTPSLSAPFWMSCPTGMETLEDVPGEERFETTSAGSSSHSSYWLAAMVLSLFRLL